MNRKAIAGSRKLSGNRVNSPIASPTEADVLPRRIVLRGALAAGFGLLAPATLLGCDSQNPTSSAGSGDLPPGSDLMPPASPASDTVSAAPADTSKVSQVSVRYQPQPKGEQKCGNCMHFIADSNTCKLVEGTISPDGWCVIWANAA